MRFGEHVQGICEEVFGSARPSRQEHGLPFGSFRGCFLISFRVLLRATTARRLGLGVEIRTRSTSVQRLRGFLNMLDLVQKRSRIGLGLLWDRMLVSNCSMK